MIKMTVTNVTYTPFHFSLADDIDGLVQERRNSSTLAMELCLSCSNPLVCKPIYSMQLLP